MQLLQPSLQPAVQGMLTSKTSWPTTQTLLKQFGSCILAIPVFATSRTGGMFNVIQATMVAVAEPCRCSSVHSSDPAVVCLTLYDLYSQRCLMEHFHGLDCDL